MIVTVNVAVVLVVAIVRAEDRRTERTGEVINVIFSIQGGNI